MTEPARHRPDDSGRDWATILITAAIVLVFLGTGAALVLARQASPRTASDPSSTGPAPVWSGEASPTLSPTTVPTSSTAAPTVGPTVGPTIGPGGVSASAVVPPQPACTARPVVHPLRVVSFNIHSALHRNTVMIGQIESEIDALTPDIVLLQEVDAHRGYSDYVDMPTVLSNALHMYYAYGVNKIWGVGREGPQQYGTLILTRFPIVAKSNTPLVNEGRLEQRGLLHTVLDVDGTTLSVYNTHLENNTPGPHGDHLALRGRQAAQAAAIIAKDPYPTILGGDMNSGPGSAAMNSFESVLSDPWSQVGVGSPNSHGNPPNARIDYLLHRGTGLTPVRAQVGRTAVSDHSPVITDYQLAGTKLVGACATDRRGSKHG